MSGPAPDPVRGAPAPGPYRGIQAAVARWLQVPTEPPTVPPGSHAWTRSERPAEAFLRYLQLRHWLGVALFALPALGAATLGGVAIAVEGHPLLAAFGLLLVVALVGAWAVVGHYALRLRFDTTWYVMTDRAIRIRRGIWTIREVTVTVENAQNVRIRLGPVQRWLGIGDVTLETAAAAPGQQQNDATASRAVIEGVAEPRLLRDRIVERMRAARGAGLGDDDEDDAPPAAVTGPRVAGAAPTWTAAHLELLRQIRDEAARLARARDTG